MKKGAYNYDNPCTILMKNSWRFSQYLTIISVTSLSGRLCSSICLHKCPNYSASFLKEKHLLTNIVYNYYE